MTLNLDLVVSYHYKLPFIGDHTIANKVKEVVPLPDATENVKLPFGLSIQTHEDGTTIHLDVVEMGVITLVDVPIAVGGSKAVNLQPLPGFHIVGTIGIVA